MTTKGTASGQQPPAWFNLLENEMTIKDTGGPAFPTSCGQGHMDIDGMYLRDYFAAKAMQGELACQREGYDWSHMNKLAEHAYKIADAMLEARSK